ncbi:ly6/PLAUR domain-containing protein 3-like isoform X2 [Lissotriton helveticus]
MPQPLECYSCIDRGDNGCATEKLEVVQCVKEHDVCIEAVMGVQSSHDHFSTVIKHCGLGGAGRVDKALPYNGLTVFIQVQQCNTSRCNNMIDLAKYRLIPIDTSTTVPKELKCYSCMGKAVQDKCLPSDALEVSCFSGHTSCFDGNTTVTVGNSTVSIPIKSCSKRSICAKETLKLGGATFTIKGACCSGALCNTDLSNITQQESFPVLEMYPGVIEEATPGQHSTGHSATQVMAKTTSSTNMTLSMTSGNAGTVTSNSLYHKPTYGTTRAADIREKNSASKVFSPVWGLLFLASFHL